MKHLLLLLMLLAANKVFGQTDPFESVSPFAQDAEEFSGRRSRVINSMSPGSVMILRSPKSSDMFDYSRRGGYFYYLTGIDEPRCTLVIFSKDFKMTPG